MQILLEYILMFLIINNTIFLVSVVKQICYYKINNIIRKNKRSNTTMYYVLQV